MDIEPLEWTDTAGRRQMARYECNGVRWELTCYENGSPDPCGWTWIVRRMTPPNIDRISYGFSATKDGANGAAARVLRARVAVESPTTHKPTLPSDVDDLAQDALHAMADVIGNRTYSVPPPPPPSAEPRPAGPRIVIVQPEDLVLVQWERTRGHSWAMAVRGGDLLRLSKSATHAWVLNVQGHITDDDTVTWEWALAQGDTHAGNPPRATGHAPTRAEAESAAVAALTQATRDSEDGP